MKLSKHSGKWGLVLVFLVFSFFFFPLSFKFFPEVFATRTRPGRHRNGPKSNGIKSLERPEDPAQVLWRRG